MSEHRARKRFGQNFLRDSGIIDRILRTISAKPEDALVEIGPGQGALTSQLAQSGARLTLVELDRDLIPLLQTQFENNERVELIQADALKTDFSGFYAGEPLRIVGNLPYNISTPLIFHLLRQHTRIHDMHFMLQKEVVDRLAAAPNTKAYGRLSVMTQYYCQVEPLFDVPPEAFTPRPKVTSAVVKLIPFHTLPHPAENAELLQRVVREAFSQRRKTLRNALKTLATPEQIEAAGINPSARAETLALTDFVGLANTLNTTD